MAQATTNLCEEVEGDINIHSESIQMEINP